jgi:hypothetical protein
MNNNIEKNMNMNMSEKEWTEVKNKNKNIVKPQPHPCQYCSKSCFGLQCKECHLKMIAVNNADCLDCKTSFKALRPDGTKKKRCFDCQKSYSETYYKNCPKCNDVFRCMLDDGRAFDKCFKCYSEVKEENKKKYESRRKAELEEEENTKPCNTTGCFNKTKFSFCSPCFRTKKNTEDSYMISRCIVCNYRIKGNYRYCSEVCSTA